MQRCQPSSGPDQTDVSLEWPTCKVTNANQIVLKTVHIIVLISFKNCVTQCVISPQVMKESQTEHSCRRRIYLITDE